MWSLWFSRDLDLGARVLPSFFAFGTLPRTWLSKRSAWKSCWQTSQRLYFWALILGGAQMEPHHWFSSGIVIKHCLISWWHDNWDRHLLQQLYEDWLCAKGDWTKSATYANACEQFSSSKRGRFVYKTFKDLTELYGLPIAKDIRLKKKEAENSRAAHEEVFWMKHPEVPDDEVACTMPKLSCFQAQVVFPTHFGAVNFNTHWIPMAFQNDAGLWAFPSVG